MKNISHWLLVIMYIVPIIGTLASIRRKTLSLISIGDSLRNLLPHDKYYTKLKGWEARYTAWRTKYPIHGMINLDRLNQFAGKLEYAFGHLRDYTLGLVMTALFVFDITYMLFSGSQTRGDHFPNLFYHGFFALLSMWTYRRHVNTGIMMTEFMRVNPHVHPQEFFEHYYRRIGPAATPVPAKALRVVNPLHISYKTGKRPTQGYWPLIRGLYDTAIFARSAYKALESVGPEYGRDVFDVMASLWGSRMLQLFKAELTVEGAEKFHNLSGKVILVFNHKSHLDFVFNFFALSSTHLANGRSIRPRYMAAKDHFVDNKFVYSGLGVGKLIESVDSVFVDRKGKGKDAVLDACRKLGEKEIEIAMYPQGTRALWNSGPNGERWDAGYYTTGTARSLKRDMGHMKKGCSFLAIDTAMAVKDRNMPVHLVMIGIEGTGTLIPKGSMQVQTEGSIKFTVGEIVTVTSQDVQGLEKPESEKAELVTEGQQAYSALADSLQKKIHTALVAALGLHEKLKTRLMDEVKAKTIIPKDQMLVLNHQLNQYQREGVDLPFVILDLIYALPPREQSARLKEFVSTLIQQVQNVQDVTVLQSLRDGIVEQVFQHRGQELKAIQLQEKQKVQKQAAL